MKKRRFIISIFTIFSLVCTLTFPMFAMASDTVTFEQQNITAFANDATPVIGKFKKDNELEKLIKQKEELALKYYNSKKANSAKSDLYLKQFKNFNSTIKRESDSPQVDLKSMSRLLSINQVPQETNY